MAGLIMAWISNIYYERPNTPDVFKWKEFGRLWYDSGKNTCSILLNGFRFGRFVSPVFKSISDPPYLAGDICVWTGEYKQDGISKDWMWIGHLQSSSNAKGRTTYFGDLEIDPLPCMVRQMVKCIMSNQSSGLFLKVFLDSNKKKGE